MSGQWRTSTRRARLPANWSVLRRETLERDGWQCTWRVMGERCPVAATDVDHIIPNDDHSDQNRRSLCAEHHRGKSAREGAAASAARAAKRYRPREQHPGMIRPN